MKLQSSNFPLVACLEFSAFAVSMEVGAWNLELLPSVSTDNAQLCPSGSGCPDDHGAAQAQALRFGAAPGVSRTGIIAAP
ncbi:MAG: hypothetical protein HY736_01415 [Verrucomicrobia bacterium]|nr:hypothetical protein [Verrucomicrobiota bacterium]